MVQVFRVSLPESYLLILNPDSTANGFAILARALYRASRSGKPAVCVDCSLLTEMPDDAIELLLSYHYHFSSKGLNLVLCHVCPAIRKLLSERGLSACPPILPSLLDAGQLSALKEEAVLVA
ncbi:STAS domain-containing protein [Hymenobacter jejuensis]|uniref:STAS domain-containing protein n=1 Tax=Hymenobacter jejuensis TaxID=2502781 RepID=A0A5B8A5R7_9BACT|nr:hypothetical protein [Hymenobacter jejuensis]QDA61562.1 hypothetical protein FHG12_16300 [Hymenobacter jejuensis]